MNYKLKKIKNGMKAVVVPMKNTATMTVLVLVGTGSVYEDKKINGISHYLEHLFFKGTKKRPKPGEINRIMDQMGAEHNAFTSKEVTGFWIKSATANFPRALDVVSDILINPLFKSEEIEKERGVILQEISMYEDMPQRDVWSLFDELMYGDQPAGWDIAGTPDLIKGIKREEILKYKKSQYKSSNITVIVSGDVDANLTLLQISKLFKDIPVGNAKKMKSVTYNQTSPQVKIKYKESDQTHLVLGGPAYNMFDKKKYALKLLTIILGGNMSSRLFMEIREKLGLAYYVGMRDNLSTYGGQIVANAGVPHQDLKKVVKKITEIFGKVYKKGITKRELDLAKDYIRGMMALSFESSDELATFYGEQALWHKKILSPQEILKKLEKVSKDEVDRVAKDVLNSEKLNLALIGPHKDANILKSILSY